MIYSDSITVKECVSKYVFQVFLRTTVAAFLCLCACTNGALNFTNTNPPFSCTGAALTNFPYAGGSGTSSSPYYICTAAQMNNIGLNPFNWSNYFRLGQSISLSAYTGTQFNIIGNSSFYFTGVFDGQNYTISNFTYPTAAGLNDTGLFGYVQGSSAAIRNLKLSTVNLNLSAGLPTAVGALVGTLDGATVSNSQVQGGTVSAYSEVGGLVGSVINGATVINCNTSATVSTIGGGGGNTGGLVGYISGAGSQIQNSTSTGIVSGGGNPATGGLVGNVLNGATISTSSSSSTVSNTTGAGIGGLVGEVSAGNIFTCSASGSVTSSTGGTLVGGLIGQAVFGSSITSSSATGAVSGTGSEVGGLIGFLGGTSTVANSYATGAVTNTGNYTGGLVGQLASNDASYISQCYATGNVTTGAYAGGLVGYMSSVTGTGGISESYATGNASGSVDIGGLVGYITNGSGTIQNSFAQGTISATVNAGGSLIGYLAGGSVHVTNCYGSGTVSGGTDLGGFVGYDPGSGVYSGNFFDGTVNAHLGDGFSGTIAGVTGASTVTMQTVATFIPGASWSNTIWNASSVGYMRLVNPP